MNSDLYSVPVAGEIWQFVLATATKTHSHTHSGKTLWAVRDLNVGTDPAHHSGVWSSWPIRSQDSQKEEVKRKEGSRWKETQPELELWGKGTHETLLLWFKREFSRAVLQWNVLEADFFYLAVEWNLPDGKLQTWGTKNMKCSTFALDFLFGFSRWHGKVTVISAQKMNVFNFPFYLRCLAFEKIFENGWNSPGADSVSHPSVMLVISELNR